jgi:hypothetical protein
MYKSINVLGGELKPCCNDPKTGFFRNGKCDTCKDDIGIHTVCVMVTKEFLSFSKKMGNDLSTPMPAYNFPGLKPGDKWCLCASRWKEAYIHNLAPPVYLESTHHETLKYIELLELQQCVMN